jgi:hypothetical protein
VSKDKAGLRRLLKRTIRNGATPASTTRKPVDKTYGANAQYGKGPGETAYEIRRRERLDRTDKEHGHDAP